MTLRETAIPINAWLKQSEVTWAQRGIGLQMLKESKTLIVTYENISPAYRPSAFPIDELDELP